MTDELDKTIRALAGVAGYTWSSHIYEGTKLIRHDVEPTNSFYPTRNDYTFHGVCTICNTEGYFGTRAWRGGLWSKVKITRCTNDE